jgi:NADP-dependent 3-hydroxy acid dehydrogenase YdfG
MQPSVHMLLSIVKQLFSGVRMTERPAPVTGGSSGIGLAIARVLVMGDRGQVRLRNLEATI